MSETGSKSRPSTDGDTPAPAAQTDPYAQIAALARETHSEALFMRKVLRYITQFFASPYAAIHIRYAAEVVQDDYHVGRTDPNFWKSSLQDFLTDSLGENGPRAKLLKAKSGDTKVAFISAPFVAGTEALEGALALVVAPVTDQELPIRLTLLEALTRYATMCIGLRREMKAPIQEAGMPRPGNGSGTPMVAAAVAAKYASAEELAFSLTNELRNKLGSEQVALGLVVGRRVRVLSVSGLDQINRRSPGIRSLVSAMEECLDAEEPVAFQRADGWQKDEFTSRRHLHKQWSAAAKGDAVASIPLRVDGVPVAILSLRNGADKPFHRKQLEDLRTRVEPYAPALLLARTASRGVRQHMMDSARQTNRALWAPGRYGRRIAVCLAVLALLGFVLGSLPYRLTVPCVVTAARMRHIAAPYDGVLVSANVLEGDRVREGDVLCAFDRRDIDQQLTALWAELDVLEREKDRAMAADSPVEVQLAHANQELVRARLAITQRRAERADIRAPFDGVIVAGDLRKMTGGQVQQGSPLFQIAPLDQWRLELEVPQSAIAVLTSDMEGFFASYARPEEPRRFRISRVLEAARIRQDKNVFVAEADIKATDGWLRPGMEGVAKIEVGSRHPWWLVSHRIADWLRMKLWL